MNTIGERINYLRKEHSLSMAAFAEIIGASPGNVGDWESEKRKSTPGSNALITIAEKFNISLDWLMTGREKGDVAATKDTYEEPNIFFEDKRESTSQNEILKTFWDLTSSLNLESIEILTSLAKKLSELDIYKNSISPNAEKRPSKNKGLIISDGSSHYIPSEGFIKLPLVGRIPAGDPIVAHENIEEYIAVPQSLLGNSKDKHFLLQVKGTSMINVGINEGDYVVARQQNTADNGEIVIALTNDIDATVKTFYKERDYIRLQPENDLMKPIIVEEVKILAKVIAVYRISQQ